MGYKKAVERVSEEHGVIVVEDTRGNYHMLNSTPEHSCEHEIILEPEFPIEVNVPPAQVIINNLNEETYRESIFLNGLNTNNFPNTSNFYPVPNLITGATNLTYLVPTDKKLIIKEINITQTRESLSIFGLYKNSSLYMTLPFYIEKNIQTEVLIFPGTVLEVKIKPGNNLTRVGISIRGNLCLSQ